ncbi:MAG: acylphosphatase [Woeseia sp.]
MSSHKPSDDGFSDGQCRRFRITGRVQGVFFRDSTRQVARKLDLTGYARNEADGSVEVVACGRLEALDTLADWLHSGPPMASVVEVETSAIDAPGYDDFSIA